mgnify:CR=1 FL=1
MRIGVDAQGNDNGGSFSYDGGNIYLFNSVTEADRNSDQSQYEGTWNVLGVVFLIWFRLSLRIALWIISNNESTAALTSVQ